MGPLCERGLGSSGQLNNRYSKFYIKSPCNISAISPSISFNSHFTCIYIHLNFVLKEKSLPTLYIYSSFHPNSFTIQSFFLSSLNQTNYRVYKRTQAFKKFRMDRLTKCEANYVPLTPLTFLKRAGSVYANRTSIIYENTRFTWSQTYERCCRLASSLRSLNILSNHVVSSFQSPFVLLTCLYVSVFFFLLLFVDV